MSYSITTAALRPFLRASPIASCSTSTSTTIAGFSTTSPNFISRAKQNAKRKKSQVLALRQSRQAEDFNPPDPVLGHIPSSSFSSSRNASASSSSSTSTGSGSGPVSERGNPWEGCRLQQTVLTPEQVWSAPPTDTPAHYLHGLSPEDQQTLFGAVPYTTLSLSASASTGGGGVGPSEAGIAEQEKQVSALKKILDLRNASKPGIEVMNRQRIIEAFGRKRVMREDGSVEYEGEPQSGGSEVQAALLTQKIRNLHTHLVQNPRDTHNKRPLRTLVHQRAKVLKYLKRTRPGEYEAVLKDLGLERRAVEGELIV